MSDVAAFLNQTGQLARAFEKNHPTPAQKAQQQQGICLIGNIMMILYCTVREVIVMPNIKLHVHATQVFIRNRR
jgi:hypothetical protein